MSTRELRNIVEALPEYNEQYDKLSLHVDVSPHYTHKFYNTFLSSNKVIQLNCNDLMY